MKMHRSPVGHGSEKPYLGLTFKDPEVVERHQEEEFGKIFGAFFAEELGR